MPPSPDRDSESAVPAALPSPPHSPVPVPAAALPPSATTTDAALKRASMPPLMRSHSHSYSLAAHSLHPRTDPPLPPALGMRDPHPLRSPRRAARHSHPLHVPDSGRELDGDSDDGAPVRRRRFSRPHQGASPAPHLSPRAPLHIDAAHAEEHQEQLAADHDAHPSAPDGRTDAPDSRLTILDSDRSLSAAAAFPGPHDAPSDPLCPSTQLSPAAPDFHPDQSDSDSSDTAQRPLVQEEGAGEGGYALNDFYPPFRRPELSPAAQVGLGPSLGLRASFLSPQPRSTRHEAESAPGLSSDAALSQPRTPERNPLPEPEPAVQLSAIIERSPAPHEGDGTESEKYPHLPTSASALDLSTSRFASERADESLDSCLEGHRLSASHLAPERHAPPSPGATEATGSECISLLPQPKRAHGSSASSNAATGLHTTHLSLSRRKMLAGETASPAHEHDTSSAAADAAGETGVRVKRLSLVGRQPIGHFAASTRASKARVVESPTAPGSSAATQPLGPRTGLHSTPSTPRARRPGSASMGLAEAFGSPTFPSSKSTTGVSPRAPRLPAGLAGAKTAGAREPSAATTTLSPGKIPRLRGPLATSRTRPSNQAVGATASSTNPAPAARAAASSGPGAVSRRASMFGASRTASTGNVAAAGAASAHVPPATAVVPSVPGSALAAGGFRSFSPPANMRGSRVTPARRVPITSRFSAAASGFPGLIPQSQSMGQLALPTSAPATGSIPSQTEARAREPSPTSSSGSSPQRRPGPAVPVTEEGEDTEKAKSAAVAGQVGDDGSKSAPKARPRYTSALSSGPSTATAPPSTGVPTALPSPSLGAIVNLATAKSTPNAQTAATRRRLQGGFGEMVPSFQRNAGDRIPFTSSASVKGPAVSSSRPSMVSSASAQPPTGPTSLPPNSGVTAGNRPAGHRLRRSLSHHVKDFEVPTEERSQATRVPRRSEAIRKRTTTLPGISPTKPVPAPMLPPLNIAPLDTSPARSPERSSPHLDSSSGAGSRRRLVHAGSASSLNAPVVSTKAQDEASTKARAETSSTRQTYSTGLGLSLGAGVGSSSARTGVSQFGVSTGSTSSLSLSSAARAPSRIPRAIASLRQAEREKDKAKERSTDHAPTTRKTSASMHIPPSVGHPKEEKEEQEEKEELLSSASVRLSRVQERVSEGEQPSDVVASLGSAEPRIPTSSSTTALHTLSKNAVASAPTSNPILAIVSAYTAAKTQSEIDTAMRRARVAVQSQHLTSSERSILQSLFAREKESHAAQKDTSQASTTATGHSSASTGLSTGAKSTLTSDFGPAKGVSAATNTAPAAVRRSGVPLRTNRLSLLDGSSASTAAAAAAAREGHAPLGQAAPGLALRGTSRTGGSNSTTPPLLIHRDDERAGDEEMAGFARRAESKKRQAGASQEEIDALLSAPAPEPPSRGLSRRQAEIMYGPHLNEFEIREMYDYDTFYYCGQNASNKWMPSSLDQPENNFGYDDDRGDYRAVSHDHLAYRYEVIDLLGRGSFGQVLRCKDHKTGEWVAIKLIRNKKRFHHQALVEVDILRHLTQWDPDDTHNVIKMTQSFYFRDHLCISTELLNINLYELIKANGFTGLSLRLVRRITTQVLASLCLLRKHRVVHCDLKPENILLCHPAKSAIKVIDFGSSCLDSERVYTYIQSRFYRSPEVILGLSYNTAIDMWSLGCIAAELYTGYPLFPGENEQEQLACIMEVLGTPDKHLVDRSSRKKFFFDQSGQPRPVKSSRNRRRRPGSKTLAQVLRSTKDTSTSSRSATGEAPAPSPAAAQAQEDLFIDFVSRCLLWDPERRLRPEQAMRHPWILAGRRQNLVTATTIASSASGGTSATAPVSLARRSTVGVGRVGLA